MFKRGVLILLSIILFVSSVSLASAALGISPAIIEINFVPGAEHNIKFEVITDDSNRPIEVFLGGDLSKYASLSKNELIGGGTVFVNIKLPNEIEKPGIHPISFGAREKVSEEQFIGTLFI